MRALMFQDWKTFPALTDVDRPTPAAGEVLLKVAGAGACHSDVAIYDTFDKGMPGAQEPPFILGHENAGWVEELGAGVQGVSPGHAYLVDGPIGCGRCTHVLVARTPTARTWRRCRTSAWPRTPLWDGRIRGRTRPKPGAAG